MRREKKRIKREEEEEGIGRRSFSENEKMDEMEDRKDISEKRTCTGRQTQMFNFFLQCNLK